VRSGPQQGLEATAGSSVRGGGQNEAGAQGLLISDSDRDQISAVLDQHVAQGRLTIDELEQRLDLLFKAQTRWQAAAVIAGLPALTPPRKPGLFHRGHHHESCPELPSWLLPEGVLADSRSRALTPPTNAHDASAREQAAEHYERVLEADKALEKAKADAAQEQYEDLVKAGTVDTSAAWVCPMCGHENHAGGGRCTQCRHEF
jgi:hypothetical protein